MVNKMISFSSIFRLITSLVFIVSLAACQTDWQDPAEGAAVKSAVRAQSVYPDGRPDVPTYGGGRDGITARSSIEAYQRSFSLPAGGAAGGGSAPSPTPSAPPIQ
jgi:hypothetical protein